MALPIATLTRPTSLNGETNGKIDPKKLVHIPSLHGGKTIILLAIAARAFIAMRADAAKSRIHLEAISSYRTYAEQEALFRSRYVPYFTRHTDGSVRYRIWNGVRWYHRTGATTAVPGTSNHSWALAIDFIITDPRLQWLLANAHRYGFSWELQSENWHLRYVAGDKVPQAVLDYEASLNPAPPAPPEDDMPKPLLCRFGAKSPNVIYIDANSVVRSVPKAAVAGYQTKQGLDGASKDVCVLASRQADGTFRFTHKDPAYAAAVVEFTTAIVSMPYVGDLPTGWAAWWKGPRLT